MTPLKKVYTVVTVAAVLALGYWAIKPGDEPYTRPTHSLENIAYAAVGAVADTNCDGNVDEAELEAFRNLSESERIGRLIAGGSLLIIEKLITENP